MSFAWLNAAAAAVFCLAAPIALAQSYNYIAPAELKQRLESGARPFLLDIQPAAEFSRHHLPGAVATDAYPARTDAERAKLKPVLHRVLTSTEDVVIVCPGGGSGARNTVDFLKAQGVADKRMLILDKGQKGWPYPQLVVQGQ